MGLGALLTVGLQSGDPWVLGSFTVFGITMVLLYTMSTLYHSFQPPGLKRLFQLFDHISIYLLIAGTYTPMLVSLRAGNGYRSWPWSGAWPCWASSARCSCPAARGEGGATGDLPWDGVGLFVRYDGAAPGAIGGGFYWLLAGGLAYTRGWCSTCSIRWAVVTPTASGTCSCWRSICHFVSIIGYVR